MPPSLRFLCCLSLAALFSHPADAQKPPERLAPLNEVTVGAEYSNTSSHIILGQSFNRRLAGLDVTWSRRVGRYNGINYLWEIELRPVAFLQDPVETVTATFSVGGTPLQQFTIPEQPVQRTCASLTASIPVTFPSPTTGQPVTGTLTQTRTCGTRWTYAGGLSPVGQRLNFLPRHELQPYLLANGGFLVSTHDLPVNDSSRFNFTFTFGTGLQWFRPSGAAWSLDYRVQHLSNKKIGDNNPGIDSQIFRVGYTFPLHKAPHGS
jgi:hypothetical protein